jgi:CheY-like chemotaxis protein
MTIVDDKNRGYSLGATGYMIKPVNRDELTRVLRNICGPIGRNMLLVDDDDPMRKWMRKVLERDGWSIVEAENGRVALTRLAQACPDVIVLDLMMPEMDGFEFLVELRRHVAWREIPVLIITAKDLTADEQRRLNGDGARVLQKGAPALDELLREITRSLPGTRERSGARKSMKDSG